MARATVDESVLQERVKVLQQESSQVKQQQPILTAIQIEQQKLMLDNQLLRRQLQALSQQRSLTQEHNEQQDLSTWLMSLNGQWQQTTITTSLMSAVDNQQNVKPLINWQLSLKADSPLAQLCQKWHCYLAYAYKDKMSDSGITPLHQQLFRPFSRMVHIDDKYISHWQILTIQAYPPEPLTDKEQTFLQSYQVKVLTTIGQKIVTVPLVHYDISQGALVIHTQGTVNHDSFMAYDPQSRQGNLMCGLKLPKECRPLESKRYALHLN